MTRLGSACEVLSARVGPGDATPTAGAPRDESAAGASTCTRGRGASAAGPGAHSRATALPSPLCGWRPLGMCRSQARSQETGSVTSRSFQELPGTPSAPLPLLLTQAEHGHPALQGPSAGRGPGKPGSMGRPPSESRARQEPLPGEGPGALVWDRLRPPAGSGGGEVEQRSKVSGWRPKVIDRGHQKPPTPGASLGGNPVGGAESRAEGAFGIWALCRGGWGPDPPCSSQMPPCPGGHVLRGLFHV